MAFIGEQEYIWLLTDDNIIDIKGQHATKWIVTKCLKQNTIMTLHGTNTLKVEECCNGDDDNDININDEWRKPANDNAYHHKPWPSKYWPYNWLSFSMCKITEASQSCII